MTMAKTKDMLNILKNLSIGKKALIVIGEKNENIIKSANNIPGITTTLVNTLNVYDILNHEKFIVTKEAVQKIEEVYA